MRIVIESIPHAEHRYPTVGDWSYAENGDLTILVSEMRDRRHMLLVAIHELIECELCLNDGVTTEMVDDFDMGNPQLEEPGEDAGAPYHRQHMIAYGHEMLLAQSLGVDWTAYSDAIEDLG